MKHAKKIKKMRRAKSRAFRFISVVALLSLLYFGIKCFVYAEEVMVEQQAIGTEEVQVSADVLDPLGQSEEATETGSKGFADLIPDGVVYDPKGESFITIDEEVIKEGEYYYEFLLESITPDMILFSSDDEEYEIPVNSIDRLDSIIESFEDIYVEGILYDAQGESYVVINDNVARVGDTVGGFLVESIGNSQVFLRKADLRFEVTIPHFEEEARKLEQPEVSTLADMPTSAPVSLDPGVVTIVD